MSLHQISERLKTMGLNEGQIEEVLDMVRAWGQDYGNRLLEVALLSRL